MRGGGVKKKVVVAGWCLLGIVPRVGGLMQQQQQVVRRMPSQRRVVGNDLESLLSTDECVVAPSEEEMREVWETLMAETRGFDTALFALPIVGPLLALSSYEGVAWLTRVTLDVLGQRNSWVTVDGNVYQIAILAPVVNGIVVPAVSIALGTMTAATVSTLRQRQVDIRTLFNSELCELDMLRTAVATLRDDDFVFDDDIQDDVCAVLDIGGFEDQDECDPTVPPTARLTLLLRDYVSRLIREARPGFSPTDAKIADTELAVMHCLLFAVDTPRRRAVAASEATRKSITALQDYRSERLAKLASTFPPIHYAILSLCGVSIIAAFLIESDQEVLRFLDAVQLRILFTILVGAFSGLSALVIDLADLHRGTSRLTPTSVQLFLLRDYLTFDLCAQGGNQPLANLAPSAFTTGGIATAAGAPAPVFRNSTTTTTAR